jgi:hypothetical protein
MQIESYRTRLEEFEQNLNRELYRYRSGLKDRLDLVSLYSNYSDFFCLESIREIDSALKIESFESRRKSLEKILLFLMDQYLDFHTAALNEESLRIQAKQNLTWEGREIPVSHATALLRTESDALRRRKLSERHGKALEESAGLRQRKIAQLGAAAADLGFNNYVEARERISGVQYENLLSAYEEILRRFEDGYWERLRVSMEATLGVPFHEAGSWDVAHWEGKNDQPLVFAEGNLLGVVESTVSELGIRPEQSEAVSLDLERTVSKQPGACCIPIRIPDEIKIVMTPGDGSRHYAALMHECGHAYHFAWTSPSLPPEHRLLGDRALSESYAFLIERFLQEREWLTRMLRFPKSESFLRFQALHRIFLIRLCVGNLRFALRIHGNRSFDDAPHIYSETMQLHTGLRHTPELWSADLADPFACADYLRGWALEAMLREHLCTRYGTGWAGNRSAAGFLKEIWETGLLYRADELCREIGFGDLEPQLLADKLWEGLQN